MFSGTDPMTQPSTIQKKLSNLPRLISTLFFRFCSNFALLFYPYFVTHEKNKPSLPRIRYKQKGKDF